LERFCINPCDDTVYRILQKKESLLIKIERTIDFAVAQLDETSHTMALEKDFYCLRSKTIRSERDLNQLEQYRSKLQLVRKLLKSKLTCLEKITSPRTAVIQTMGAKTDLRRQLSSVSYELMCNSRMISSCERISIRLKDLLIVDRAFFDSFGSELEDFLRPIPSYLV
jgi:hypothetical protein